MNLYEIDNEVMKCIDTETGEIIDPEKLDALDMERNTKIENIACWIKNLKSDADALKSEKLALADRQKVAENKAESLKKYLSGYLNGEKFSTAKAAISFRKSESVSADINELMKSDDADKYLKYSEPTADKTAIKEALKEGIVIPGCSLVQSNNIQIK